MKKNLPIIIILLAAIALSSCQLPGNAEASVTWAEPVPLETVAPPVITPAPTPVPTPEPVMSQEDIDRLEGDIDWLIGTYRLDTARSLLFEARQGNLPDAYFESFAGRIDEHHAFNNENLVLFEGEIEHIFTHCLIAFPEITYSGNPSTATIDFNCITAHEFKLIIESLYRNNFILIDINIIFEVDEYGAPHLVPLYLPEGKKPVILSIDDVEYDPRKRGRGMVDKLIVEEDGRVSSFTEHADGTIVISRDNELFPILDEFVTRHPRFSFRGAKGTLAVTGYAGLFGYRTHHHYEGDIEAETAAAIKVAEALKEAGWNFASHSYAHAHMNDRLDLEGVRRDTEQWANEVAPIVGDTMIFIYPYGERFEQDAAKHQVLLDAGFRLFGGVWWSQAYMRVLPEGRGLLQFRRNLDGFTLRIGRDAFMHMFDTEEVIDPIRQLLDNA